MTKPQNEKEDKAMANVYDFTVKDREGNCVIWIKKSAAMRGKMVISPIDNLPSDAYNNNIAFAI